MKYVNRRTVGDETLFIFSIRQKKRKTRFQQLGLFLKIFKKPLINYASIQWNTCNYKFIYQDDSQNEVGQVGDNC